MSDKPYMLVLIEMNVYIIHLVYFNVNNAYNIYKINNNMEYYNDETKMRRRKST